MNVRKVIQGYSKRYLELGPIDRAEMRAYVYALTFTDRSGDVWRQVLHALDEIEAGA